MDDTDRVRSCPECGSDEIGIRIDTRGFGMSVNTDYPWPLSILEKLRKTPNPDGYDRYVQCNECGTETHLETKTGLNV